jgi:diguanylate cyclase (GGDEF)-like protein
VGRLGRPEIAWANVADALVGQKRFDEAIAAFKIAGGSPGSYTGLDGKADILAKLGETYLLANRDEEAIDAFRRAIEAQRGFRMEDLQRLGSQMESRLKSARAQFETVQLQERLRLRSLFVGGLVLLIAVLAWAWSRVRRANRALAVTNSALEQSAQRDPLTGLANRRPVQPWLDALAQRDQTQAAVFLLDIDHFKSINDGYGHDSGDAVLTGLAKRLERLTRSGDLLSRWGGEEFLLLVKNVNQQAMAAVAERILCSVVEEPFAVASGSIVVSVSIGYVSMRIDPAAAWHELLTLADLALYRAKREGRNRACGVVEMRNSWSVVRSRLASDSGQLISDADFAVEWRLGPQTQNASH